MVEETKSVPYSTLITKDFINASLFLLAGYFIQFFLP